ncbi:hypothetical protein H8Z60_28870 [Mycolicibacterium fortuitum]|nr:hypothetical protein [Mycolicibacterium fortuitum]
MPGSPRAFNRTAAALAVIAATAAGCATPDVATVHTTAVPTTNAPSADPGQGRDLLAAASNNDAARVRERRLGSHRTGQRRASRPTPDRSYPARTMKTQETEHF